MNTDRLTLQIIKIIVGSYFEKKNTSIFNQNKFFPASVLGHMKLKTVQACETYGLE